MNKKEQKTIKQIVNFIESLQNLLKISLWQKIKSFCKRTYFKIKNIFLQRKYYKIYGLHIGDKIVTTGFTVAAYNGTFTVKTVKNKNAYR